jgi:hypothetical protein
MHDGLRKTNKGAGTYNYVVFSCILYSVINKKNS